MNSSTIEMVKKYNQGEVGVLDALGAAQEVCGAVSKARWERALSTDPEVLTHWCEPAVASTISAKNEDDFPSDWLSEFLPTTTWWQETGLGLESVEWLIGEDTPFVALCSTLLLAERENARHRFSDAQKDCYGHA